MVSRNTWNDRLSTLKQEVDFSGQDDQRPAVRCRTCRGTGWEDEYEGYECLVCLGEGEV